MAALWIIIKPSSRFRSKHKYKCDKLKPLESATENQLWFKSIG